MSEKVVTPKARLCFPALFRPKKDDTGREFYQCTLVFPKGEDLNALKAAIKACAEEAHGKLDATIKIPLKANATADKLEKYPIFKDAVWLNAKSKYAPVLLNEAKQPIIEEGDLYAGCYVHASVTPYAWTHKTQGKGVGLNINGVLKAADGERLGAVPGQEFEDILVDVDLTPQEENSQEEDFFFE